MPSIMSNKMKRRNMPMMPMMHFPNLLEEFEQQMQNMMEDGMSGLSIYEEKNNIIVEAHLPGLKREEIDVNLNNGILWIKGEKKEEEADKNKKYYRKAMNTYSYRITIPEQIDEQQEPKAEYKDGTLKIAFMKSKQGETKKISIK